MRSQPEENSSAPVAPRIFWALTEGAVAAVLLVGGGLGALQTAAITSGLPFALLLIIITYSLMKGLDGEYEEMLMAESKKEQESYQDTITNLIRKREKARTAAKSKDDKKKE
ncbi:MAG: BCCT family transporter [Bacteroidales bacterium]|nr:BCCT family transporter [Bacteroidales bacterium]